MAVINYTGSLTVKDPYRIIPVSRRYSAYKKACDTTLTILLLPVALAGIALGIVLTFLSSKGPVIFIQERVGLGGRVFRMYKIRTMVYKPGGYTAYTVPGDERVTPVGRLLRKTKIDELPQIINVLRGEMSLIGPRPERVEIANYFSAIDENYAYRHCIKPGITGLAQVYCPLATPKENLVRLNFDLYYITNFSLLLDVLIIIKTVVVICRMKGL
ncbi:MAG TPA: sugar transferase [Chitinophagaceae bacterium]|nr:sugar transferase [Chitinophagaceae bacterium]